MKKILIAIYCLSNFLSLEATRRIKMNYTLTQFNVEKIMQYQKNDRVSPESLTSYILDVCNLNEKNRDFFKKSKHGVYRARNPKKIALGLLKKSRKNGTQLTEKEKNILKNTLSFFEFSPKTHAKISSFLEKKNPVKIKKLNEIMEQLKI